MDTPRKLDLEHHLDAYFATLRPSSFRATLRRSAASWHLYAAVTGSAVAMATSASAQNIATTVRSLPTDPIGRMSAGQPLLNTENLPLRNAIRSALDRQSRAVRRATAAEAPTISPGGVVPIYSAVNTITPGEWISIYGTNLAGEVAFWDGDFPTMLGGTSVEIDGKPAYLIFVSPDQINLQAPDDTATGTVSVAVTTAAGTATSTVTLGPFAPSFCMINEQAGSGYVAAILPRSDGSGAYGDGTYDILGPTGTQFGYPTVAAQPGDVVELYGVGFGPTNPAVPAGQPYSGAAQLDTTLTLYINGSPVNTLWAGLSSAGLYQINFVVPDGLGEGVLPILAEVGGMRSQPFAVFTLAPSQVIVTSNPIQTTHPIMTGGNPGTPGTGGNPPGTGGNTPGTGGNGNGTGGTGGDAIHAKKPYHPRLQFPPH